MSRRKQSNPARHLDGDNENRGAMPIFTPNPAPFPDAVTTADDVDKEPERPVDSDAYLDPVLCVHCQQEFFSPWDLMAHEKTCVPSNPDLYLHSHKTEDGTPPLPLSRPGSELGGEEEEVEDPGISQEELMSRMEGELEEGEEEVDEEFETGAQSDPEDYLSAPMSMAGPVGPDPDSYPFLAAEPGKNEENKENNSGLGNQNDEGDDPEPSNGEVVDNFHPAMTLSSMFPGNNVTLEPMSATKAAVAQVPLTPSSQMPDSSPDPEKAIEEWKRKDLMNQQIIQRMQMALMKQGINMSELMYGMNMAAMGLPGMDMSSVMMGPHSVAGYLSSQAHKLQKEEAQAGKEDGDVKDLPKDLSLDIEQAIKQVDRELGHDKDKHSADTDLAKTDTPVSSTSSSSTTTPSVTSSISSYLASLTSRVSSPVTSNSLSALSSLTNGPGLGLGDRGPVKEEGRSGGSQQYSSSSLTALQRETDALKATILPQLQMPMTPEAYRGYCQRGTVLERAQYACDDPFFKHKCRFCHKVFGSDSALQIHVRSHTGERPFKCNICGNRFSTKGNLKVHFERHKAKYPHIKMNPNPVPESFDRLPPVVPPPMSSPTPIPSSLPLPSGMMHGEPHSPHTPRMMFPPGGGPPGGFFPPSPMGGFLPHPFARLPGPPLPHHPMLPGTARPMLSPSQPKPESLPPPSPSKPSPRDTPKSGSEAARSPSRAEADFSAPPSHGSSEKLGSSSRASSPPPPSSSVPPPLVRSQPGTPVSSMAGLGSPPIPPLIHSHPHMLPLPHSMPSHHPLSRSTPGPIFSNHSLPATPTSFPLPSPLNASFPGLMRGHGNPFMPPSPLVGGEGMFRNSILPSKTIDPSENLEQYMEIQKSETDKLQQLVNNIPDKVREPNQCVICQRVLSCKSALQMHYRIHTGERPFKCKICNRKFTTKGNLKTHMGVHRTKSPLRMMHSCPVCHKTFTNILVLQTHIRQQHGGLPSGPMHPMPVFPHLPGWPGKVHLPPGPPMLPPPPLPHKPYEPFDLSRHHEPRELDLSNKRHPGLFEPEVESKASSYSDGHDQRGSSDIEEDEDRLEEEVKKEEEALGEEEMARMMEEEREEEAYNLSRDGGSSGPASHGPQSALSDNGDSDRPESNVSAAYNGYDLHQPLPPSGDNMDPFLNPSQPPPRGVINPSLAALEDSVKSLSANENQSGFERFRNSLGFGAGAFMMDKGLSPGMLMPHTNGGSDKSPVSPKSQGASEAGSDGSREDSKFPMSDFGLGHLSFPLLGMDMGQGLKNSTTCPTCFKTFACRSALDIHMRSHTKERPFQCDECQRAFSTRGNLKQHQLTHRPDYGQANDSDSAARDNNTDHSDADSGQTSDRPAQESTEPAPPQSDSEPNANSNSSTQNSDPTPPSPSPSQAAPPVPPHTPSSTASGNTSSPTTKPPSSNNNNNNKLFPDGNSIKKEPPSSVAPSSPRDGSQGARRPKHMCEVCMKPFSSASALQIHTRTHTGDKPFKCTVCNKAFTTRGNLKVHMGTHMYNNSPSRRGRRMSIDNPLIFAGHPYLAAAAGFPPRPPLPHDPYFPYQPLVNGMGVSRPNEISVIQNVNGALGHPMGMYPGFQGHPFSSLAASEEAAKHAADLSLARAHSDSGLGDRDRRRDSDREPSPPLKRFRERSPSPFRSPPPSLTNGTVTSTGELDLSMKTTPKSSPQDPPPPPLSLKSPSSPSRLAYPASPALVTSPPAKAPVFGDIPPSPPAPHAQESAQDSVMTSSPPNWVWNALSCHRCAQTFPSRPSLEQHIQTHHLNVDSHPGAQAISA